MCSRRWEWCSAVELLLLPLLVAGISGVLDTSSCARSPILSQDSPEKITCISGSNVTLKTSKKMLDNYIHGTWFYTTNQKIVEWDSNKPNYFNTKFKQRVELDPQSAALHIYNVEKSDSSTYLLRVSNESGSEYDISIILEVFDPVPNFVIKTETKEVSGVCYMNLSCEIPDQSVDYIWHTDSGPSPKELHRSVLQVTIPPQNKSNSYTCQISNPVSSQNDTVYFLPPCNLDRSSGVTHIVNLLVLLIPTIPVLLLT
ncbi:CD48 antigen isoform X1 [Cavia porcellus]|uniref:CD48 antigen isoform X1 n=1 Tax=Cavia porcellus TaxID=10141 RepID=UPI002FE2F6E3